MSIGNSHAFPCGEQLSHRATWELQPKGAQLGRAAQSSRIQSSGGRASDLLPWLHRSGKFFSPLQSTALAQSSSIFSRPIKATGHFNSIATGHPTLILTSCQASARAKLLQEFQEWCPSGRCPGWVLADQWQLQLAFLWILEPVVFSGGKVHWDWMRQGQVVLCYVVVVVVVVVLTLLCYINIGFPAGCVAFKNVMSAS